MKKISLTNRTPDYSLSRGIVLLGMISILEKEVSVIYPVPYKKSKGVPRSCGIRVLDYWRFKNHSGDPSRFRKNIFALELHASLSS